LVRSFCRLRDQIEDRAFTIGVRDGEERGQMVVPGMFPGLAASVLDSPGGRVFAGGQIIVQVPPAAQPSTPYRAWFEYLDNDDPLYSGENAFISGAPAADTVLLAAPAHQGHFMLRLEMTPGDGPSPAGTILHAPAFASAPRERRLISGPWPLK
jgi:hypothetical protein